MVSHRDGAGEAGRAAGPGRRLPGIGPDLPEAAVPQLGEGADAPGRSPARLDLQCRGAGQLPASPDAEDGGYRVRTPAAIRGRIALDRFREAQGPSREETMKTLHHTRLR